MEVACENSANLEQETKTTKIITYPLFPLVPLFDFCVTKHTVFYTLQANKQLKALAKWSRE